MTAGTHDADVTRRRIVLFVACSIIGAVLVTLAVIATGGLAGSPPLIPGTSLTVATVLLACGYMFTPALSHLLVRRFTGEGWAGVRALLRLRGDWRAWLVAWLAPTVLTLLGAALYYLVRPAAFDPAMTQLREALPDTGNGAAPDPVGLLTAQLIGAITVAPLINAVFAFGEEFGWRGYLQPKLLELTSPPRAMLLMGVIWGAWHWPLIAIGYEYGTEYPGFPFTGFLLFPVFTFAVGTLLGWITARSGSVLPAALGHGAVNASAGLGVLALRGDLEPMIGPLPIGIVSVIGYLAAALVLLWRWPQRPAGVSQPVARDEEGAVT